MKTIVYDLSDTIKDPEKVIKLPCFLGEIKVKSIDTKSKEEFKPHKVIGYAKNFELSKDNKSIVADIVLTSFHHLLMYKYKGNLSINMTRRFTKGLYTEKGYDLWDVQSLEALPPLV